jgi:hypothetical protein
MTFPQNGDITRAYATQRSETDPFSRAEFIRPDGTGTLRI